MIITISITITINIIVTIITITIITITITIIITIITSGGSGDVLGRGERLLLLRRRRLLGRLTFLNHIVSYNIVYPLVYHIVCLSILYFDFYLYILVYNMSARRLLGLRERPAGRRWYATL